MHRDSDHVGVLLLNRVEDAPGGLTEPQVDDLHARIAEHAGHHLEATVVAVKTQLGEHHPDRKSGTDHHTTAVST